jgi:predicted esterase
MTALAASWTDLDGATARTTYFELKDNPNVNPSLPVVILLHGMGGNIHHMANPGESPGANFNLGDPLPPAYLDRGWYGYPNVGYWSIGPDPEIPQASLTSWEQALQQARYDTVNYGQIDPNGLLARPVRELNAVFRKVLEARPGKRVAFVCHSRGGLLVRLFLQQNKQDKALLSRIAGIVTLHSPHQGSKVADFAAAVHTAIGPLRLLAGANLPFQIALSLLDDMVTQPAITELSPESSLLTGLAAAEKVALGLPIPIHTFGGTSPRLVKLRTSAFDAMSAVPQWHWPPFHWQTYQSHVALLDGTPVGALVPEVGPGGDVLVTDARSRLPGEASHGVNPVNHAAALWYPALQAQVKNILNTWAA